MQQIVNENINTQGCAPESRRPARALAVFASPEWELRCHFPASAEIELL